jgi:hypothetical protein
MLLLAPLLLVASRSSKPCGPNPGGQLVSRGDGTTYPYFGMPCNKADGAPDPACGDCYLDDSCTCAKKCCAPREGPPGYACLPNGTDLIGTVCVAKDVGVGKTLAQLADACDAMYHAAAGSGIGCAGFNTDGFLKKCVRKSCGATLAQSGGPMLQSCFRTNTPVKQPIPKGSNPTCHHGPAPAPPAGPHFVPPYGGGCAGTWNQSSCNCSGVRPPFGAPQHDVQLQKDYHFPMDEAAQRAGLPDLQLVSVDGGVSAVLRNPSTKETATLIVGGALKWGWELLHVGAGAGGSAVLEHDFDEWSELVFLFVAGRSSVSVRKPVGRLSAISQPLYTMETIDAQFHCE